MFLWQMLPSWCRKKWQTVESRTGDKRLRSAVSRGSILCQTIHRRLCATELFYAAAQCRQCGHTTRLSRKSAVEVHNEKLMFRLIRASFNQRRKTLQNGIANSAELSFTKEQAARAIEQAGFDVRIRGEKLGLEEFARLADELERMTENG